MKLEEKCTVPEAWEPPTGSRDREGAVLGRTLAVSKGKMAGTF